MMHSSDLPRKPAAAYWAKEAMNPRSDAKGKQRVLVISTEAHAMLAAQQGERTRQPTWKWSSITATGVALMSRALLP
eukprot:3919730-Pleurochrysis_carterae.AAC.5